MGNEFSNQKSNLSGQISPTETERNLAKFFVNELLKLEKFFVKICTDVLIQILCYGDRGRLSKLERVGRRFHLIVTNRFGQKPFFRLSLDLNRRFWFITFIIITRDFIKIVISLVNFYLEYVGLKFEFIDCPLGSQNGQFEFNLKFPRDD